MLHVPLHIKRVTDVGGVSRWVSSVCWDTKYLQTHDGIFWPREWPLIKLKHIKLGKPEKQEHYPSKSEGTPATAKSNERVKGPPHPRPKQDDRQQKLLVPTNQNVQWKKVCAAWYENPKNHMGKIGNVSPNQCSHTKPLGVKGKKDTTLKIKKVNVRELRWIYMYYNHPTVYTLQQ